MSDVKTMDHNQNPPCTHCGGTTEHLASYNGDIDNKILYLCNTCTLITLVTKPTMLGVQLKQVLKERDMWAEASKWN